MGMTVGVRGWLVVGGGFWEEKDREEGNRSSCLVAFVDGCLKEKRTKHFSLSGSPQRLDDTLSLSLLQQEKGSFSFET